MNLHFRLTGPLFFVTSVLLLPGCQRTTADRADPNRRESNASVKSLVDQSSRRLMVLKPVAVGTRDNRELFKNWAKPEVIICLTGRQNGYIEPCGCTGLENQKGGLARRHTLYKQLDAKGWNSVKLDVGNLVRRFGVQPELKFQSTVDALRKQEYDAVAFGPDDLRLSIGELIASVAPLGDEPSLFVCANASVLEQNGVTRVLQSGGKRIGVTAILGKAEQKKIQNPDIELSDPAAGLQPALAELKQKKCDLLVLLSHASSEESIELAKQFPDFHVVVTAGGAEEPALRPRKIPGTKSILVEVGGKGMYVGVIGLFGGDKPSLRYERVVLDDRYPDSKQMLEILHSYQKQLETMGLAGLGLKPVAHPSGWKYVGSEACSDCHTQAYEKWQEPGEQGGGHSQATQSIAEPTQRAEIRRHHDPECLSCHVTGWNPQGFFPYRTGYLDLKQANLHGNGCENCHGPGSQHVAAENGDIEATEEQLLAYQKKMRVKLSEEQCMTCHDLDNSPDFHVEGAFEKYWEQIAHPWKD